ncbi:hypothetical protein FHS60_001814 [Alloprevotella rava]|uniref:Uncharacterized protein n=1 Tax=Alloprevotella rava TaxID=671218 RepID=A0A7W5UNP3_9BACT|nr:hypothetical protein [Alloprevotella rava]
MTIQIGEIERKKRGNDAIHKNSEGWNKEKDAFPGENEENKEFFEAICAVLSIFTPCFGRQYPYCVSQHPYCVGGYNKDVRR